MPSFLKIRAAVEPLWAFLRSHRARKKGQTLVEYSLILVILTILAISVFGLLGNRLVIIFSAVTNLLDTAQSSH